MAATDGKWRVRFTTLTCVTSTAAAPQAITVGIAVCRVKSEAGDDDYALDRCTL